MWQQNWNVILNWFGVLPQGGKTVIISSHFYSSGCVCCHLSFVLPVIFCFVFFFSLFIIIPNGQIFGVFHFYYHGSHRTRQLSLQVVHATSKQAFIGMAGLKNWLYVGHQPLIVSFSRFVAFLFPAPTFYYLSSSPRLHIHFYLQRHLFTGRETDSEERPARKGVRLWRTARIR